MYHQPRTHNYTHGAAPAHPPENRYAFFVKSLVPGDAYPILPLAVLGAFVIIRFQFDQGSHDVLVVVSILVLK